MSRDDWRGKLHPALRALVDSTSDTPASHPLTLLVRVQGAHEHLRGLGLETGSRSGDVLLARALAGAIPAIAQDPAVVFLELSRPLHYD